MRQASAWLHTTSLTGNDRVLLDVICDHAGGDFGMCVASQKRLAYDCGGVRRQTIVAALARLVDKGYVEKLGVTDNDTLMLRPCFERPPDREPYPIQGRPEDGQPLFPTNRDGSAVLTPVRKADTSEKRTRIESDCLTAEKQGIEEKVVNNQPLSNARARNTLTDLELAGEFELQFWPGYPRKVSKPAALKAFVKARRSGVDLDAILDGLGSAITYWSKSGAINARGKATQYVPHGATWLNAEGWNDEHPDVEGKDDLASSTDAGRDKARKWAEASS